MALADELNDHFVRTLQGTPWILAVTTGEGDLTGVDPWDLIQGLTAAVKATHDNVLRLARELDASR